MIPLMEGHEMKLRMGKRSVNGVTILDLSGEIVLGEESSLLRKTLRDLIAGGDRKILLNLGALTYIDTSGLGTLISAFGEMNNQKGQLKLLSLTKRVHAVMQITKLLTVFDVFDSEEEAINSF